MQMKSYIVYITKKKFRLPEIEALKFGCTCSKERCANALIQIGVDAVHETLEQQNPIRMDCQFCNTQYTFTAEEALALFGEHLSYYFNFIKRRLYRLFIYLYFLMIIFNMLI